MCRRASWRLSSVGERIGTSLLSRPQPLCVSVYLSLRLSVSVPQGKLRPFADTHLSLFHTHIYFLSLSVYHSCSFHPSIHLPVFLLSISGVFQARAAAVASGVIQCDRMKSITHAQASWTGLQTARHYTNKYIPIYTEIAQNKQVDYASTILKPAELSLLLNNKHKALTNRLCFYFLLPLSPYCLKAIISLLFS